MNENELLLRARQGSLEAFNSLVLNCQDRIFNHALWMFGDPEAAAAITQKTFLQAYQRLDSLQEMDFCPWLLQLASRLCLEELQRREPAPQPGDRVASQGQDSNNRSPMRPGLHTLPPDLRLVLALVDLQEMDYAQTAQILGLTRSAVQNRLAAARRCLLAARATLHPSILSY